MGLHTCTAVAHSLCISWAFLLVIPPTKHSKGNFPVQQICGSIQLDLMWTGQVHAGYKVPWWISQCWLARAWFVTDGWINSRRTWSWVCGWRWCRTGRTDCRPVQPGWVHPNAGRLASHSRPVGRGAASNSSTPAPAPRDHSTLFQRCFTTHLCIIKLILCYNGITTKDSTPLFAQRWQIVNNNKSYHYRGVLSSSKCNKNIFRQC